MSVDWMNLQNTCCRK